VDRGGKHTEEGGKEGPSTDRLENGIDLRVSKKRGAEPAF